MPKLVRLSISLEKSLYDRLEEMVDRSGYTNRSEYIRDLIRERRVEEEWHGGKEVVGTLTLVYDHHARQLNERLVDLQHHHHHEILVTTHVHLDARMCAEVTIMKGKASDLRRIADLLRQQKGVLHGALSFSSTGSGLE